MKLSNVKGSQIVLEVKILFYDLLVENTTEHSDKKKQ